MADLKSRLDLLKSHKSAVNRLIQAMPANQRPHFLMQQCESEEASLRKTRTEMNLWTQKNFPYGVNVAALDAIGNKTVYAQEPIGEDVVDTPCARYAKLQGCSSIEYCDACLDFEDRCTCVVPDETDPDCRRCFMDAVQGLREAHHPYYRDEWLQGEIEDLLYGFFWTEWHEDYFFSHIDAHCGSFFCQEHSGSGSLIAV